MAEYGPEFNNASNARLTQQQQERRREDDKLLLTQAAKNPFSDADTTTVGADIGNFFRVLMAFLSGLWNRDFYEFDLLSSVYFPPTNAPPAEGTQARTEYDRVNEMRRDVDARRSGAPSATSGMTTGQVADYYSRGLPPNLGFNEIVKIFLPLEGGFNPNEPRGAVANYGINSEANPDINVRNLTQEGAIQRYRTHYWNAVDWSVKGATSEGQLSSNVKLLIFDSAAQYGPSFANKLLRDSFTASGGDQAKMTEEIYRMRREKYAQLIRDNPGEYARYQNSWDNRLAKLESITSKRWDMNVATNVLIATPPVDILKYRVSDDHGHRERHPVHGRASFHRGTDYAVPIGTPLTAHATARVASMRSFNGYGNTIVLDYGDGVVEMSAHLSRFPRGLKVGDTVRQGDTFAYTGNSGTGTGAHLHHELWIKRNGVYYTVDEQLAKGKNLRDPAVQTELINDAMNKGTQKTASTISSLMNLSDEARTITVRNTDPAPAPVVPGATTVATRLPSSIS